MPDVVYTRTESLTGDRDAARPRVEFSIRGIRNNFKSEEEGRPIFEDVEYITIFIPGDAKTIVERKVTEDDKIRFGREYEGWQRTKQNLVEGTPLSEWTLLNPAMVLMLNSLNIMTVEELAGLKNNDAKIQNIGTGGRKLVNQAVAYLESAKDAAATSKLVAENEALKERIDTLEKNLAEVTSALDMNRVGT
jgi:hypothetical protein